MYCMKIVFWAMIIICFFAYLAVMLPVALNDYMMPENVYDPATDAQIRADYILAGIGIACVGGLCVVLLVVRSMDR